MILMVLLSPLGLLALLLSMERVERWTVGDGQNGRVPPDAGLDVDLGPSVRAAAPQ